MSNPISLLFGALGYYKYDKFVIGAAATLNIILSVMLVLHWGLVGVLFGTTVSWLLYWCSRVIILYKKYYQFSAAKYIKRIIRCVIATILAAGLVFVFDLKLSCMGTSVSLFIVKGILYVILVLIIDVLTFWGTEVLQYGGLLLNKVIKR